MSHTSHFSNILTYEFCKRFLFHFRGQSKVNQLGFISAHVYQDILWQDTSLLAVDVGLQDLGKISPDFSFCQWSTQAVSVMYDVKQVFTDFWSFHDVNIMLISVDHFIYVDHVTMPCLALKISLRRNFRLFTVPYFSVRS